MVVMMMVVALMMVVMCSRTTDHPFRIYELGAMSLC